MYVFKTKPLNHQREALTLSWNKDFFAFLMEMGTGKTKVAIDTIGILYQRGKVKNALIVVPKTLMGTWCIDEIPKHLATDDQRTISWKANSISVDKQLRQPYNGLTIFVINIDALNTKSGYLAAENFLRQAATIMVVDESSIIKNPSASRTKRCIKLGRIARYRRILTGTPVPNGPLDVYSQFDFLSPSILNQKNFQTFKLRYARLKDQYFSGRRVSTVIGYQRLDELQSLINPHSYRKLKSECLDLPPKIYTVRYVDFDGEQKQQYEKLRTELLLELKSGSTVTTPLAITKLMKLRQILCGFVVPTGEGAAQKIGDTNPKLDALLEILDSNPGQKALIWCSFIPSLHEITAALNARFGPGSAAPYHGGLSLDERDNVKKEFQYGTDIRYLVLQNKTGARGLTLTAATLVIYFDNDWSLEIREQSEDRCHRNGTTQSVTYVDLVAKGTIDDKIRIALRDKKDIALQVTGDIARMVDHA